MKMILMTYQQWKKYLKLYSLKKIEFLKRLLKINVGMLLNDIIKAIDKNINEYNKKIAEKFNISIDELQELSNDFFGDSKPKRGGGGRKKKEEKTESIVSDDSSGGKSKTSVEGGCPYIFIKGKDEGKTCNSKPKDGCEYCGRHQKYEGVGQKEKKKIPTVNAKKNISDKAVSKPKSSPDDRPKIIIRLNKDIDKYWNPETCLVFKSKDDRVVINSYKNDKLEKLTNDDIATCEKYGFRYEKIEEKKEIPIKVANDMKKSISEEIVKTNVQAEHIESVLNEICKEEEDEEEDVEEEDVEEEECEEELEDEE